MEKITRAQNWFAFNEDFFSGAFTTEEAELEESVIAATFQIGAGEWSR